MYIQSLNRSVEQQSQQDPVGANFVVRYVHNLTHCNFPVPAHALKAYA